MKCQICKSKLKDAINSQICKHCHTNCVIINIGNGNSYYHDSGKNVFLEENNNNLSKQLPVLTLNGHDKWITSLAVLKNGYLASASIDGSIIIWNTNNGEIIKTCNEEEEENVKGDIKSLAVLNDGFTLVSSHLWNSKIKLWKISCESWKSKITIPMRVLNGMGPLLISSQRLPKNYAFYGHSSGVWSLAVLSDDLLATGSFDSTIKIWNINIVEKTLRTLTGHNGPVEALVLLQDKGHIASGSMDHTVKIWHINTGKLVQQLISHTGPVSSLCAFSKDKLISGSRDKTIKIWNVLNGTLLTTFNENERSIECLTLVNDDQSLLASGSSNGEIKIWNTNNGALVKSFEGHSNFLISSLVVLPDGRLVSCSRDLTIKIWNNCI